MLRGLVEIYTGCVAHHERLNCFVWLKSCAQKAVGLEESVRHCVTGDMRLYMWVKKRVSPLEKHLQAIGGWPVGPEGSRYSRLVF